MGMRHAKVKYVWLVFGVLDMWTFSSGRCSIFGSEWGFCGFQSRGLIRLRGRSGLGAMKLEYNLA